MKGVSDERRDMGDPWDAPPIYETVSSTENRLKFRCIIGRKTYVDRITIINSGADQSMNQSCYSMERE